ncbi:MAG: pseudouridine synthase [Candidatus Woesearchaeota archaeon]|nr:pseudouridine synthase [Candidatus Woesearchaeota archaeon]
MPSKISVRSALRRSGLFDTADDMKHALKQRRVCYNNKPVPNLGYLFSPKKGLVVDGKPIVLAEKKYFVLNKPVNTSCQKNEQYKYVVDFIEVDEQTKKTLFPVGRLDVPTTGLIIITNDGDFAIKLLNPKKEIIKRYKVLANKLLTDLMVSLLEKGVMISVDEKPYTTKPAAVEKIDNNNCFVSITEGKYRQIRKMFEAVGNRVMALCRVEIGKLKLVDLGIEEGQYKEIKKEDVL